MSAVFESKQLDFPRLHGPAVGAGILRQSWKDFVVEEQLGFELTGAGEHVYLKIRKCGANTGWVSDRLAEFLELRYFDVGYAGKKDRHAVTTQWFSCWLPGLQEPDLSGLNIEGVELLDVVRHERKLRIGAHSGNRFRLQVTNLSGDQAMIEARLDAIRKTGFPNYFGKQRFGIDCNNLKHASMMFAGTKFARKKRGIYLSAARSWLFNQQVAAMIDAVSAKTVDEDSWKPDEKLWLYGLSPHRDITIPPLSPSDFEQWGKGLEEFKVKASERQIGIVPTDLKWTFNDDGLLLSFDLPPGAYATSLVQELIQFSDADDFGFDSRSGEKH
ncbi:MAG: tRNA pseudouridine(13) synthase TruD [Pseudomonadales bacterium]|nr:tRNA pseudouridine(13) synthase TruD [Pseudomonadales bacterium]MDG1442154.1 tRNA pseudouridine(13) synthase TruD [Pseudomonadales bacterium]